jgi:hypothetical protein
MPKQNVYLQSVEHPERKYLVLKYDEATRTATLRGLLAPFDVKPFTKEKVQSMGYKLVKEPSHAKPEGIREGLQAGGEDRGRAGGAEGAHDAPESPSAGDEAGSGEAA